MPENTIINQDIVQDANITDVQSELENQAINDGMMELTPGSSMALSNQFQIDSLGSKIDAAVKHNLSIDRVAGMDNSVYKRLDLPPSYMWYPEVRDLVKSDPKIASIYATPEKIDSLNRIAKEAEALKVFENQTRKTDYDNIFAAELPVTNEAKTWSKKSDIYGNGFTPKLQSDRDLLKSLGWEQVGFAYVNKYDPLKRRVIKPPVNANRDSTFFGFNIPSDKNFTEDQSRELFSQLNIAPIGQGSRDSLKSIYNTIGNFKKKMLFIEWLDKEFKTIGGDWRGLPGDIIQPEIDRFAKTFNVDMSQITGKDFTKVGAKWGTIGDPLNKLFTQELQENLNRLGTQAVSKDDVAALKKISDQWLEQSIGSTGIRHTQEALAQSIPWMVLFMVGSGFGNVGKQATMKLLTPEKLNTFSRKVVGSIGSAALLTPTVFADSISRSIEEEKSYLTFDENYNPVVKHSDLSDTELLIKHSSLAYINVLSEMSGGALKYIPGVSGILKRIGAKAAGKGILSSALRVSKRAKDVTQFHGMFGELGEDALGGFGEYALTQVGQAAGIKALESIERNEPFFTKDELGIELATIGIISGVMNAPAGLIRLKSISNLRKHKSVLSGIYDQVEKYPEVKESKEVIKTYLHHVTNGSTITVNARNLQTVFQEGRDSLSLRDALGINEASEKIIIDQAKNNGTVEIDSSKLLIDSANRDVFEKVLNLAEDIPGGKTIEDFENELKNTPEMDDATKQKIALETQLEEDYINKLNGYTKILKSKNADFIRFEKSEVNAGVRLLDAMVRTFAHRVGVNPIDIINNLEVKKIKFDDFKRSVNDPASKAGEENRGAFYYGENESKVIALFEKSRLDTFAHETFHFVKKTMVDFKNSGIIENQQFIDDIELLEQFENGNEELGAIAFEKYLRDGKAPNSKLKSLFKSIRNILLKLYAQFKNDPFIGVTFNREIQEVFDRMLISQVQADEFIKDESVLKMINYFNLSGLNTQGKKNAKYILEQEREQIFERVEQQKNKERESIKRNARKEANDHWSDLPVSDTWSHINNNGKIPYELIQNLDLADSDIHALIVKGAITRPRRTKKFKPDTSKEAFMNWLHDANLIAWAARDILGSEKRIVADKKFGIIKGSFGSFFGTSGTPSDIFARQISDALGYEVSEEELIDALANQTIRSFKSAFSNIAKAEAEEYQRQSEEAEKDFLKQEQSLTELAMTVGYNTSRDMVNDLVSFPKKTTFIKDYVDSKVSEFETRFDESYYVVDASIVEQQIEDIIKVLSQKASSKKEGLRLYNQSRKVLSASVFKELRSMKLSDITNVNRPMDSIRKNSEAVIDAMKKQDWMTALKLTNQIRFDVEMMKQKIEKREEIKNFLKNVKSVASYKVPKSGPSRYLGSVLYHIQDLAFKYRIVNKLPTESNTESLDSILEKFHSDNRQIDLPGLAENGIIDIQTLTYEEYESFSDIINFLTVVGSGVVQEAEKENKRLNKQISESMLELAKKVKPKKPYATNVFEKAAILAGGQKYYSRRFLTILRELDGWVNALGKGDPGLFEEVLLDRLAKSSNTEKQLIYDSLQIAVKAMDHLAQLSKVMDKNFFKAESKNLPEVPTLIKNNVTDSWNFESVLAVVLNIGTYDNYKKLQDGYAIHDAEGNVIGSELDDVAIQQIVDLFKTEEDWNSISMLWQSIETILPAKKEAHKLITYTDLKEVEKRPFDVNLIDADGNKYTKTIEGGYYHIQYDNRIDRTVNEYDDLLELQSGPNSDGRIMAPNSGDTKRRVSFTGKPIRLDFQPFYRQIYSGAHNAAYAVVARDIRRILSNTNLHESLKTALGENGRRAFYELLTSEVNPRKEPSKAIRFLDSVVTAKSLWMNLSSALMQHSGVTQGITNVGFENFMRAHSEFLQNPIDTVNFVNDKDPFMRDRFKGTDYDLRNKNADIILNKFEKGVTKIKEFGFIGIRLMDSTVSYPMWMAEYTRRIAEGKSESDAIYLAGKLIAETQGSGRDIDKIYAQQRPVLRFFVKFFSAVGAMYNRQVEGYNAARTGQLSVAEYSQFIFAELIAPALYSGLLRTLGNGVLLGYILSGKDDERNKFWSNMISESIAFGFQGIPVYRDIADITFSTILDQPVYGKGGVPIQRPIEDAYKTFYKAAKAANDVIRDEDNKGKSVLNAVDAAAQLGTDLTGVPLVTAYKRLIKAAKNAEIIEDKK